MIALFVLKQRIRRNPEEKKNIPLHKVNILASIVKNKALPLQKHVAKKVLLLSSVWRPADHVDMSPKCILPLLYLLKYISSQSKRVAL